MNEELNAYEIIYEGTVREFYYVYARDPEHARQVWVDTQPEPGYSEMIEGGIETVEELHGDE